MASAVVARNSDVHDQYDTYLQDYTTGVNTTEPIDPTVVYTSVDFDVSATDPSVGR